MKALHPDFIQEVKDRIDIVDVISEQVSLKKAGKEYQGLCPFHDERTPSFSVSRDKKLAHCFGCSWGGNAFKFVMELNKVSFTEAALDFARRSNVPIRYADGSTDDNFPAALPQVERKKQVIEKPSSQPEPKPDVTKSVGQVNASVFRLQNYTGDAEKAREWLAARGITLELIDRYRIGFEKRVVKPDESNPDQKETYWAIAIFIPVPDRPDRFYEKKRAAPWLVGDDRPNYLGKWLQYGVPATIWFTYKPEDAEETWFCEGEWDAIVLGEFARKRGEKVAVACSTSGCGTVPSKEQLDQLPGKVRIFYDHDDAGHKGAEKLAKALGGRGQICSVPIPEGCEIKGWDVSNALAYGYEWEDFVRQKPLISKTEWELKFGLLRFFKKVANKINRKFKNSGKKSRKKPEPKIVSSNAKPSESINYKPGCIPWKSKHKGDFPKIYFKADERRRLYKEAVDKGWDIFDISQPASGKSHETGNLTPQGFFGEQEESEINENTPQAKLIYFSPSSRNPTVETIERNYTPLPVRHDGLKYDHSRKTPMGKSYVVWAKPGEQKDTRSNCRFAESHRAINEKNIGLNSSQSQGKSDVNPICRNCPSLVDTSKGKYGCQNSFGDGFGFKFEMKNALEADRIRATFQGFPSSLEGDYGVIVDEALSTLSQVSQITATLDDLSRAFSVIKIKNPELYQKVAYIRDTIEAMVNGAIKAPNFGFTLADIRKALGDAPDNHIELIKEIEKITLNEARNEVETLAKSKNLSPEAIQQRVPKNWLIAFLQVSTGIIPGSLRIYPGEIIITLKNERELAILRGAKFRIYQDATGRRDRLANFLEISPDDLLVCEQVPPKYNHVKGTQITGLPELGKGRSENADKRVEALIEEINNRHKDVGVIDWKEKNAEGNISHFSGGRGSNEYIRKLALIIVGTPWQNLGFLQDKYQALTGRVVQLGNREGVETDPELQQYINEHVEDELFQEIGRIRASRRQEELTVYIVSEFPLDNVVARLEGCQFEQKDAFEITPAAGDKGQQTRWNLMEAVRQSLEEGHDAAKLTQEKVADRMTASGGGINRSRIAQIAKEFGGWKQFRKLLVALIYKTIRSANNLSEKEKWLAQTYLPLAIEDGADPLKEGAFVVKTYGFKAFQRILEAIPLKTQNRCLTELLRLLPSEVVNELKFASD